MSIGVVVLHDDARVVEAVTETLEGAADVYVVATSLERAPSARVLVAGGAPLARVEPLALPLVALAGEEPVRAAREAIAAGARDIVRWPEEAERLAPAIRRAAGAARPAAGGRVVAVAGGRGGVGTTTVAAALASHWGCVVADLDGGGQRALASEEPARSLDDVWDALADPAPGALDAVAVPHAGGARALLVRPRAHLHARAVPGFLRALRETGAVAVVDAGRAAGEAARGAFDAADARVIVLSNDVASVRGALTLAEASAPPLAFAFRRTRRLGVAARDALAALAAERFVVVPEDAALARAVDLGGLPGRRTRALRAVARLAAALAEVPA